MLKRWAALPLGVRWLVGIAAVVLALVFVWALIVPVADLLAHHDADSARGALHETALDNARGRLLTLGAGLVAGGALVFTALNFNLLRRNSEQTDQWQRRTYELTEQGQVTDRYTKAVEQLGSDKLDVQIGGIYALERIAHDSARDHPTVMEVLTAFIREHSHEHSRKQSREDSPVQRSQPGPDYPEPLRSTRPAVRAALTVVGRRDVKRDVRPVDLTGANLTGPGLAGANLSRAILRAADLTGADLTDTDLAFSLLSGANLEGAMLIRTDLTRAGSPTRTSTGRSSQLRFSQVRSSQGRSSQMRTSPARTSPARVSQQMRQFRRDGN
jgi:hypothetical protein